MNSQPGKLLINFLCSLPWLLGPKILCLFRVSQCSLGPSPYRGLQVCLLRRGGLLLWSGGLLLWSRGLPLRSGDLLLFCGGLLLRSGGLPLHLFQSVGLQLRRGGLLPCLLLPGGLHSRLLRPGGLQFCLLHPVGLQSRLLHPGFLLCRLCLLYLSPRPLHVGLALRPSPCSAYAPPSSWIVLYHKSGLLNSCYLTTGGHSLTTWTLALHYCCTSPQTTIPNIHCTDNTQLTEPTQLL